ncbi:MAG: hypothetical protein PHQ72_05010 [Hespellia sp.]|nr:hypothetical protein [Hespellia sp.]
MFEGNKVELRMEKTVLINTLLDEETHFCKVLRYDPEEDYIRLVLEKEDLSVILLDAKYRCEITTKTEVRSCTGVIKERFCDEAGNVMIFKIENGFYCTKKIEKK